MSKSEKIEIEGLLSIENDRKRGYRRVLIDRHQLGHFVANNLYIDRDVDWDEYDEVGYSRARITIELIGGE